MDKHKRRSSIKKTCPPTEEFSGPIRTASKRQKRRISFSGKKSIREFFGEEEPKTWNNSYEVSDHVNNSGGDGQSAIVNGQRGAHLLVSQTRDSLSPYKHKMQQRSVQRAEKENEFPLQFVTAMKLVSADVLQALNQNSTFSIDNTIDITLLEKEKNRRKSFFLSDNELIKLRGTELAVSESTISFRKELIDFEQKGDVPPMTIKLDKPQQQIYDEFEKTNICEKEMIESLYKEGSGESTEAATITIIMDETINTESENSIKGPPKRRTMPQMLDMDISLDKFQHPPQQNMNGNSTFLSTKALYADMDVESPLPKKAHKSVEEVCLQEAAVNFADKLKRISIQCESDESANFEEEFRELLNSNVQEDIHYDMPKEVSLKSSINIIDIEEEQTRALSSTTFGDNMEVSLEATLVDENPCKEIGKTILFNNKNECNTMDISIANDELQDSQQECIESKEMSCSVPQTCTLKMRNEADYIDFEKQRLKRLQEKQLQEQQEIEELIAQNAVNTEHSKTVLYSHKNSGFNFSLHSLDNTLFSPEISSPLFPPEYVSLSNKKLTFRQINDDIERGKIKIFPEIPRASPTSKQGETLSKRIFSTTRENQLQRANSPKCKSNLNFEDMQTAASEPLPENTNCIGANKYFLVNDKKELTGKKTTVRYSQADDMLLDNTSYLTHAKLGDESVSRNNTKCSTSSRRETIIFNTEMEIENNCVAEGDAIETEHEKSTYNQIQNCGEKVGKYSKMPNAEISDAINKYNTLSNKSNSKRSSILNIKNMSWDESSMGVFEKNLTQEKSSRDENNSQLKASKCVPLHQTSRKTNESSIDMQINVISPTKMDDSICQASIINGNDKHRQTLYFNNDADIIIENLMDLSNTKSTMENASLKPIKYRQTKMEDSICQASIINENDKHRQTLYFNNDVDIISENLMDLSNAKSTIENASLKPIKYRQTVHFAKNNDLSLDNVESTNKFNDRNTFEDMDQQQLVKDSKNEITSDVTKSQPLNAAKIIFRRHDAVRCNTLSSELEDSLILKLNETRAATFSSGKNKTLHHSVNNNSTLDISPTTNHQEENERIRRLCEGTPHRSVIEFEYLERETKIEQQLFEQNEKSQLEENMNVSEIEVEGKEDNAALTDSKDPLSKTRRQTTYEHTDIVLNESGLELLENDNVATKCSNTMNKSPIVKDLPKKRLTANLTPIFPLSKKRQTVLFNDYSIEESFKNKTEMKKTILHDRTRDHNAVRQTLLFHKSMVLSNSGVKYDDVEKDVNIPMDIRYDYKSTKNTNELNATTQLNNTIKCENYDEVETLTGSITLMSSNLVEANHTLNNEDAAIAVSPARNRGVSRIPVRIESAKKQNSITASVQSPIQIEETNENLSLGMIEIPRRATTFAQRNHLSIQLPLPDNGEQSINEQLKQQRSIVSVYEDNPITISDVSVFFSAQKESIDCNNEDKTIQGHTKSFNTSTRLQVPVSNMTLRKSSIDLCGDNTINRKVNFKNYLNLSRNISVLSAEVDDIDETRLSLVESLFYEDNEDSDGDDIDDKNNKIAKNDYNKNNAQNSNRSLKNLKTFALCRKCKRCQETLLNETTSSAADSFALPSLPIGSGLNWDRLEKLRKRPTLTDVNEYWRRKKLERPFDITTLSISKVDCEDDEDEEEPDDVDIFIQQYKQKVQRVEEELNDLRRKAPVIKRESFVQRLNKTLCENSPNWIFDYQMQHRNLLLFSHKKIVTFHVLITYDEKDMMGKDIQIKSIQLQNSRFPKKNWQPIDFVMDFQLKLELPFNLESMCEGSDDLSLYKMLQEIDRICVEVAKLVYEFWRLVRINEASLIRDANRTFIRKIVREVVTTDDEYPRVKKSEFLIEVKNLKKLSFKDIASPPLYSFREDIQFLPTSLQFVCMFLNNPFDHLKN